MRVSVSLAVLLLGTLVPAAFGQDSPSDANRFRLYTGCEPVTLVVEELRNSTMSIGLTKDRVRIAVESRLRSARLYNSTMNIPYLRVAITVAGSAYNINLQFYKALDDLTTSLRAPAVTWQTGSTGTHARDARFILSHLSEKVDQFLLEYLRVNESACK